MENEASDSVLLRALHIRIDLLEESFKQTDPKDSEKLYLLQVELSQAYSRYNELMPLVKSLELHAHED